MRDDYIISVESRFTLTLLGSAREDDRWVQGRVLVQRGPGGGLEASPVGLPMVLLDGRWWDLADIATSPGLTEVTDRLCDIALECAPIGGSDSEAAE